MTSYFGNLVTGLVTVFEQTYQIVPEQVES